VRQVNGVIDRELHLAINAGAWIPARVVLARVDMHCDDIRAIWLDIVGRVDPERHVAVVPTAGALAIDIHRGHSHHAVEIQIEAFAGKRSRHGKFLSIPAFAAPGQFASVRITFRFVRAADSPIVREPNRLPGGVIEGAGVGARLRAFGEFPIAIKIFDCSRAGVGTTGQGTSEQENKDCGDETFHGEP